MKNTSPFPDLLERRGFALVISLIMLILLTVIAVGMLSLAGIVLRTEGVGAAEATARANARLALQIAIANLQKHAGPDQRITASADLLGESRNGNWTGVWSTTAVDQPSVPMVAGHADRRRGSPFLSDLRALDRNLANNAWRQDLRLAWLVSGERPSPSAVSAPSEPPTGNAIPSAVQLVGPGTLGTAAGDRQFVAAPYVELREGTRTSGGYAYWVGDESQKARIDLTVPQGDRTPNPASPGDGGMFRLAGAGGPGIREVRTPDGAKPYGTVASLDAERRANLVSLPTVGVPASVNQATASFHDLTTHSKGLLVDVTTGSLKKDLTSFLERANGAPPVPGVAGTGLAADAPILLPTNYRRSGPSFARLREWYQLRERVQGGLADPVLNEPVYIATRPGITGSHYNLSSPLPDVTAADQPVQPVLVDCRIAFDFSLDPNPDRANGRGIRIHLYPRVTLWNPYNVTLRGQRYFVASALPQVNNLTIGGGAAEVVPGTGGEMYPGVAPANNARTLIHFTLEAIDMGPGEALVFSPDVTASGGIRLSNNSVQYNPGNVAANVLSAGIPSGTNNFNLPTNRQVPESVNLAARPDYGFSGGVNQAFGNAPVMMLKRLRTGGGGSVPPSTLEGNSADTMQLIHFGHGGAKTNWWWYLFGFARDAVNGGTGFENYLTNPNRYPPRLWAVQTRMRWLDETDEQAALGITHSGAAGAAFYNNPVIGNFNVRAQMVFRDPFSFFAGWPKFAPGGYMIPWSTPRLNDSRMSIPYRDRKAQGSPFSAPRELVGPFAMFEVPHAGTPVFSLAAFQHAQLGHHSWQPSYVIGHSIAEPRSDRDATVNQAFFRAGAAAWGSDMSRSNERPGTWHGLVQNLQGEILVHDITYAVNHHLWDSYFLSTIPHGGGSPSWNPENSPLPNSNLRPIHSVSDPTARNLLTGNNSFDYAAAFLANYGAFNVNSTSVEAWRAMLSSLNDVPRPTLAGASVADAFSRLLIPVTSEDPASRAAPGTWNGTRALSAAEIDVLANTMVAVVRERGPFLSMSDFVNRRLQSPAGNDANDPSLSGPLQAAIERAELNMRLQNPRRGDITATDAGDANTSAGSIPPDWNAFYPFKNYGAPGYLTQADILQTLGHQLTVRGDTFVVRTYGDARDASGRVVARAWCEAVVQRIPEYVAARPPGTPSDATGNNPLEPAALRGGSAGYINTPNTALLPVNLTHGRRFVVESFRWLSSSEV